MKYNIGDIVPFEQTQEATDWVNSIEGNYYLEDWGLDENGNMQLIVRQLPEPTPEEIAIQTQKRLTNFVQTILDTEAQKLGYDNCLSVCSYVDTGVRKFDDESRAFRQWRSEVWSKGYEILNAVLVGEREIPTEEELLSELPKLTIVYTQN